MYEDSKVEGDALKMVLQNIDYLKKSRIGVYDDHILCANCDQKKLGILDDYGKEILIDRMPIIVNKDISVLDNIEVNKLASFVISVLWRCSISKREEVRHVNVGVKFENQIRELLIKNEDVTLHFPIVITKLSFLNSSYEKVLFMPVPIEIDDVNYYYVYFPKGYKVLIKIDDKPQHPALNLLTMKVGYPVYVANTEQFENTNEYTKTALRVKTMRGL